jgi:hypothetical protein
VDISSLKPFERKVGPRGPYYTVYYDLAMDFGPELLYGFVNEGRVMAQVTARYTD